MPGRGRVADGAKHKTLKSFFFPYTIPKKQDSEEEVGDTIVLETPTPSFFARYASKSSSSTEDELSRHSNTAARPRASPKTLSRRSREVSSSLNQPQASRKPASLRNRRHSPQCGEYLQEDEGASEAKGARKSPRRGVAVGEQAVRTGRSSRTSPVRSAEGVVRNDMPLKRERSSAEPQDDALNETMPRAKRRSSFQTRTIQEDDARQSSDKPSSCGGNACGDDLMKNPGPSRSEQATSLTGADGKHVARRPSTPSSVLSVASHTPSVDTPIVRRTQRLVKQTSLVIRSSQEEENEEEEEIMLSFDENHKAVTYNSDSSLEDLDAVVAKTSSPVKRAPQANPELSSSERRTRSQMKIALGLSSSTRPKPFFSPLAPTPTYKFSMNNLVKQYTRDGRAQAEVTAAAKLSSYPSAPEQPPMGPSLGYQELLSTVMNHGDTDEQMGKMMRAMSRTDTLPASTDWFAFGSTGEHEPYQSTVCPTSSLTGEIRYIFEDEVTRRCAFMTSRISDQAFTWNLPDELLTWIWERALLEASDDLSDAYLDTIKSTFSNRVREVIQPEHMFGIFQKLGAVDSLLEPASRISPSRQPLHAREIVPPSNLHQVIRRLGVLASCLSDSCKIPALETLLRLAMDGITKKHVDTQFALQDAIAILVNSFSESETHLLCDLRHRLRRAVSDEVFQLRLVSTIPDFSERLQNFKRMMAFDFLFGDDTTELIDLDRAEHLPSKIVQRLKIDPRFDAYSEDVEFSKLSALVTILDIGIAGGFGVVPRTDTIKTVEGREAEEKFNHAIDCISKRVFALSSRITESGASHMSRSNAKSTLDRLYDRLSKAVRTKARARKNVFESHDASGHEPVGKSSIMSNFLKRTAVTNQGSAAAMAS